MMADALNGKIDIILTKSISRFARNTVDLLSTMRALRSARASVRFDRERIDTASSEGEVLLTLLASFAQAESESISQNAKWEIRKKFKDGLLHSRQPYGCHYSHGELEIVEEEAVIVRRMFTEFLSGISPEQACKQMNAEGLRSCSDGKFHASVTRDWIENPIYTGMAVLQKSYRPYIGNHKTVPNTGELT